MRLIDADPLEYQAKECVENEWDQKAAPISWAHAEESFLRRIEDAPTVDAVPVVHGRWIYHDDGVITCSECENAESSDSYYCRYCGAKMDGGADHADNPAGGGEGIGGG